MIHVSESVSLAVIVFTLYTLSVLFALRINKQVSPAIIVCLNAILVYLVGLLVIGYYGYQVNFFAFSSIYWFLAISFVMYFGAILKSISLRMMQYLLYKPNYADSLDTLLETYIHNQSYSQRIEVLIHSEMLRRNVNNTLIMTRKGYNLARLCCFMQWIFSIKDSG